MSQDSSKLTPEKEEKLRRCEAVLIRVPPFHEIGRALQEIRDDKLYLKEFGTFEQYCKMKWGYSRSRAYQFMDSASVVNNIMNGMSTIVDIPVSEAQTRPLTVLEPDAQCEAWSEAVASAPDGQPTAKQVEAAVRQIVSRSSGEPEPIRSPQLVDGFSRFDRLMASLLSDHPAEQYPALLDHARRSIDALVNSLVLTASSITPCATDDIGTDGASLPMPGNEEYPALVYGSVCSGIEAATVAWHPLGWRPAWFAEIEPFASAVLTHHYPDVVNHGDFTAIRPESGSIDILVGGTPCQSFSVNGLRKGMDDDRGQLVVGFLRLAEQARPSWVLWENVPGALSIDGGRAFGAFVGGLAELGYGYSWRVLDPKTFGVPQRRRRLFVVGHLGGWQPAAAVLLERPSGHEDSGQNGQAREDNPSGATTHARIDRLLFGDGNGHRNGNGHANGQGRPPIFGLTGDESPKFGIGITPTLRASQGGEGVCVISPGLTGLGRRLTPLEWERVQGFPDHYTRIPYKGKDAAECPDRPRFKVVGNSMAIPVMSWIGQRIQFVDSIVRCRQTQEATAHA